MPTSSQYTSSTEKPVMSAAEKNLQNLRWPLVVYGLVAGAILANQPGKLVWYSFHPFCMTISFVTLSGLSVLYKKVGGADNTRLHGYLMFSAILLGAFAGYVIYSNKEMNGKPHLTSYHGRIGAAVLWMYLALGLFGYFALSPDWGFLRTNKVLRFVHKMTGKVLIASSWIAMMLHISSMYKDYLLIQAGFAMPLVVFAYYILF